MRASPCSRKRDPDVEGAKLKPVWRGLVGKKGVPPEVETNWAAGVTPGKCSGGVRPLGKGEGPRPEAPLWSLSPAGPGSPPLLRPGQVRGCGRQ